MTFQLWNFNAKPGMESAIAELAESQWGDANKFIDLYSYFIDANGLLNYTYDE